MKTIIVQPTIPTYRVGFFSRLAARFGPEFAVYGSIGDMGVLSQSPSSPTWERRLGKSRQLLPGLLWQQGVLSIPISRGDVVVVSGAPRYLSNIALLLKARLRGAKTIWWGHFWSSTSRAWRASIRLILMKLADGILFYTDKEVEGYFATKPSGRQLVSAINNGLETEEIVRLRAPYAISSRQRDLLFIGRITPKAELGFLLEALALSVCANIQLDVIGSGDSEDQLRQRCIALGIANRVVWHGGITEEKRIADVANSCKAFVYPGGVGLSLIHGLAYGLPAIVHDNWREHMPEIAALKNDENGTTFRDRDVNSLGMAIASLLTDAARLDAMSTASIDTTAQSFNAVDMSERFYAMVEAVRNEGKHFTNSSHQVTS
ncbi:MULTISPECIES: glycosyltransferase family 4 protein [unclassified Mesorhizobium]|uniref:glycosyltransferase family 4 protein n=1 Tax=unclassified Mesorhizobium TaxID=325217 RepID=UPI000FD2DEFF|nr:MULTISPECIES: glycosyltransferase family 4 protein [unclassified Mesorhizobium]RVB80570.1 glycosyltransferase [Mesorhizobium sp. M6A.T.Cr.TU.014.01.1.1]RWP97571.1 MAG: glycosyltransferase [Mesorhizobium sp.]RWQ10844.1 MAG: glycosyltransferase [Mesorhizobium sp.]